VNSIVGFNRPRRGKVLFKGTDITEIFFVRDGAQRNGAWCPRVGASFPTLSVEENLMVAERSVDRRGWNMERVYALFPPPARKDAASARPETLSGGGAAKCWPSAGGLMTNPDCLIMDEPSEGLAPHHHPRAVASDRAG